MTIKDFNLIVPSVAQLEVVNGLTASNSPFLVSKSKMGESPPGVTDGGRFQADYKLMVFAGDAQTKFAQQPLNKNLYLVRNWVRHPS